MAKFTTDRARDWLKLDMAARLQSISSDAASLVHFSDGLVSRVQLLQDAAIGIINSDQNDVMKVFDRRLGGRHSAGAGCRHLRHEFQEHSRVRLGVGLSVGLGADRDLGAAAADLVQVEGLDLNFIRHGFRTSEGGAFHRTEDLIVTSRPKNVGRVKQFRKLHCQIGLPAGCNPDRP